MVKTILYGAGNYCDHFFDSKQVEEFKIIGIVDSNSDKWGKKRHGYAVMPPDKLIDMEFEQIIITIHRYDLIVTVLQKMGISSDKIYVYEMEKELVTPLVELFESSLAQRLFHCHANIQIKISLLMEALREKEFDGYDRIIVFGKEENYEFVKSFFETTLPGINVIRGVDKFTFSENDKCIICEADYCKQRKIIRNKLYSDRQWIIIPLFDVKNTISISGG